MKIERIEITRSYKNDKQFECSISLKSDYGAIQLRIPDEQVQALVESVADLIVDAGKDVASNLTRQAMQRTAIEHQS